MKTDLTSLQVFEQHMHAWRGPTLPQTHLPARRKALYSAFTSPLVGMSALSLTVVAVKSDAKSKAVYRRDMPVRIR